MSARSSIWSSCRALAVRARPAVPRTQPFASRRWYADESKKGSSTESVPDARNIEESRRVAASALGSIEPADQPGVVGAEEVAAQEGESTEGLGDQLLYETLYGRRAPASDADEGLTKAQEESLYNEGTIPSPEQAEVQHGEQTQLQTQTVNELPAMGSENSLAETGFKFAPPAPLVGEYHLKKRYHPVLEQITRLLMRDGKLSVAQRNLALVMNFLRTSPEPTYSPKFPLLPGTPPASHLPLNPILYLTIALDSVAPLLRIRNIAGGAGGGRALEIPTPLAVRQRRRIAFQWVLDAVDKKPSKGSGRKQFPHRLAEEIVAVVEGRSSVWEKRKQVHKLGTAARSNIGKASKRRGKK